MEDGYHWKEDEKAGIPPRYSDYHKWLIEKGYKPDSKKKEPSQELFVPNFHMSILNQVLLIRKQLNLLMQIKTINSFFI